MAAKEAELHTAMDNMAGGMFMLDKDQKYLLFNQQYLQLYGFPKELIAIGGDFENTLRFQAKRKDYGPGPIEHHIRKISDQFKSRENFSFRRQLNDGTVLEIGMCSPYGAAAGTFAGGTDCVVGDYYDASDTITIPVGAQEATWFFPGDRYGEISFEVYAPDSTLLFAGAQGATSAGLLPITLCASN